MNPTRRFYLAEDMGLEPTGRCRRRSFRGSLLSIRVSSIERLPDLQGALTDEQAAILFRAIQFFTQCGYGDSNPDSLIKNQIC